MDKIIGQCFSSERALYGARGLTLEGCRFEGEEDGESALKEASRVVADRCHFALRYPFWHDSFVHVKACTFPETCRAAFWYDEDVLIESSTLDGIKALRACKRVTLRDVTAHSPELGWKCERVSVHGGDITSEYAFLESRHLDLDGVKFTGKYAFQYTRDVTISRSRLATKDAFWHAKNVTVTDSVLDGEYLGWYSEGLTLVRCHIRGTQPLCYCKRLRLVDCTMENCDLSFEYSDVRAEVKGKIASVKNVLRGRVVADGFGEILVTEDAVRPVRGKVVCRA